MDEAAIITAKAAAVPVVVTSAYLITFVMLIGVGALLVIIRKLFLLSCPFLSENAKVVAGFIDVIVFLLDVIKGATVCNPCGCCFEKVFDSEPFIGLISRGRRRDHRCGRRSRRRVWGRHPAAQICPDPVCQRQHPPSDAGRGACRVCPVRFLIMRIS